MPPQIDHALDESLLMPRPRQGGGGGGGGAALLVPSAFAPANRTGILVCSRKLPRIVTDVVWDRGQGQS